MNNLELECKNITKITEKKLNKKISLDIIKKWKRNCPRCNDSLYYFSKNNRDKLFKLNSICRKCTSKSQRVFSDIVIFKRTCNSCNKITTYKNRKSFNQAKRNNRLCIDCIIKLPCKNTTKQKIGNKNRGENNGMFGKTHSDYYKNILKQKLTHYPLKHTKSGIEKMKLSLIGRKHSNETKKKMRFSKIKYILEKNDGICPRYSKKACKFIDEYGKQHGYNFQHALNGGEFYIKELGYWVDGYDKEKNVIFEYDEPHHYNEMTKLLKEKDIIRMNEIQNHLSCKFYRYNEKLNQIIKY